MKKLPLHPGPPSGAGVSPLSPPADGEKRVERADAARNRERILEAARELLAQRPIGEVCMDELARAAGVGKGTLYRRFTDRSSLCLALLDDNERRLQERVLAGFGLPKTACAAEKLRTLLAELCAFSVDNAVLLAEGEAFKRDNDVEPPPPTRWRRRAIARGLADLAREGSAEEPTSPPDFTIDLALAGLRGDFVLARLRRGATPEQLRADYLDACTRLFGIRPGT